jgi:3-deoxy-manno-octulosonate cytidylyltransferase (CMP-KDO synthetase)
MIPSGTPRERCADSDARGGRKRAAVVIPARIGSQRFPRKVLARETGKYLLQHVWEGVVGTPGVDRVIIATDSEEVQAAARSFGAEVRMTSPRHPSGTDRVAEVARDLPEEFIIDVQGDEPLVRKEDLAPLVALLEEDDGISMATLAAERRDREGLGDPNNVKVVLDFTGRALYFSRAPIPHLRDRTGAEGLPWLHHIGIYGFRKDFLLRFPDLKPGRLEAMEKLEQLRALENGFEIGVAIARGRYRGIDTLEEYREFVREYRGGEADRAAPGKREKE